MISVYEDLTPDALARLGFESPDSSCRILQEMAGHDIPDAVFDTLLRVLVPALADCADPDRTVANLGRWGEAVGNRAAAYRFLAATPPAARILVTVLAASQFFADLLIRDPEYLEALTNPVLRTRTCDSDALLFDLRRRVGVAQTPNARRDALRRAKGPEILRIGVRDLLGDAPMPMIAREISDFADAAVRVALEVCLEERGGRHPAFAVIALGKLGGRELNYSSDIDLVFVHGDDEDAQGCVRLAEAVRETLAKNSPAGYVFRVDLRLRPEGRFGPVSRSLSSCRAYYESWAEPWERQALLKARAVAGDGALGAEFVAMTQSFVYPNRLDESVIESIRQNKRRLEEKIARAGEADINVKEGLGGIRDIEFSIQLMLLLSGGSNPAVRTGNTLDALERLAEIGLLTQEERLVFRDSYIFLRTVEHRLQLLDDRAVRCIPLGGSALRRFGRVLDYADGAAFLKDYRIHTRRAHRLFQRLFYGDAPGDDKNAAISIRQWVSSPHDPVARQSLHQAIAGRGFADPEAVAEQMRLLIAGSRYGEVQAEARAGFASVAEALLDAAAQTDRPDEALRGIVGLAQSVPAPVTLYKALGESPDLLPRLCRLAGDAGSLWQTLLTHLEFLDLLADDEGMDRPLPPPDGVMAPAALARYALRSRLHVGARDVWGITDVAGTGRAITAAAEITLGHAIGLVREETGIDAPLSVIGLGKLGGGELGYGSDWDVLYVGASEQLGDATRLAERVQQLLRDGLQRWGVRFEIDARLRPEGRKGALVLDIATYRDYYTRQAATWEHQTLLKARAVAGDSALGGEFAALVGSVVYSRSATAGEVEEVRAMKRRLESERSKGAHDLKLGPGGLSDVEWTVQVLQLLHGHRRRPLRVPGTLEGLKALRDDARITQADWDVLDEAYRLVTHLRNRISLQDGLSANLAPDLSDTIRGAMRSAREVCLRLFYGVASDDETA